MKRTMCLFTLLLTVLFLTSTVVVAQTPQQRALETYKKEQGNRPEVEIWGTEAMVSSTQPFATLAGAKILMAGGNAVDAAVAVGAALNVTQPDMNQIGGDTVMLIFLAKTGEYIAIDAYSKVPANPKLKEMLEALPGVKGDPAAYSEEPGRGKPPAEVPRSHGVLVAMIPGTAAAWTRAAEKFGTMPLTQLFASAIEYAEKGFPIPTAFANSIKSNEPVLMKYPSSAKIYCPNGKPLKAGEVLIQKDLGGTFRKIAEGGFDAYYKGDIAKAIVKYVQDKGGVLTMEDMAGYDVKLRKPYSGDYRGYQIIAGPPPTSAIHVIQQLNIVEQFDLAAMGYHSPDALHVMIEATKLAGADRRGVSGDPDFVQMPMKGLLSKKYAATRKALIAMNKAMEPKYDAGKAQDYESGDTTHFVVVDKWGNMVSCTTTIGSGFGCKEIIEGTGIMMQDRTWWLALNPPSPNIVAPGRRANIGHAPIMILKDGKAYMALGSPGADTIRQTVFQAIVNVIDFGLNIQQAIEAPRFTANPLTNEVQIEPRISADVLAELEKRGHKLVRTAPWGGPGNLEGFTADPKTGVKMGGYDPRRNSIAIGW